MKMNPVIHFEIPAHDRDRMSNFYEGVFGWQMQKMGPDMGNYVIAMTTDSDEKGPKKPGAINGGFFPVTDDNPMKHPSVVIQVEDINEHIEKVKSAGGKVIGKPMDIPDVGKYVVFVDTEGNMLSMMETRPLK
ncbi:MAG: Glyoxalase/bleomycin resistance protein/dioxygenase [Candidatus Peregrinibacteria bacterium GW2011_GWA2_33_10]|nr:MAG: Glyoxalase/bleomycin resistance protein/dioxygenase [Candidatus Peregrinibacteria bacterium GW2011_GWA2_33_10]KKP41036.1 MAG: glyoxalase/bleomycin resistance protein/dioxygenase [Candidatus Peregrinibacteria bacterium GW2011_GWC2_33_13]